MRPTNEALKKRLDSARAIQTLAKTDLSLMKPLLEGLVIAAFQNPLFRMAIIGDMKCVMHITPYGPGKLLWKFNDNPLENTSAQGEYRARIGAESNIILIEQNMGPRYKDRVERAIESSCTRAENEMARTGDYMGRAGQQFSSLLPFTLSSYGDAFTWQVVKDCELSKLLKIEVVQRPEEAREETHTFDLILSA